MSLKTTVAAALVLAAAQAAVSPVCAQLSTVPLSPGAARRLIAQPDWLAKPRGEDLANAYPPIAIQLNLPGRAVLSCGIDDFGKLQGCLVTYEAPAGFHFGAAALSMTPAFLMRPLTLNGQPVAGGRVKIPILFMLPDWSPAYEPPPPAAPQSTELARKAMLAAKTNDAAREQFEQAARTIDLLPRADISDDARWGVAQALRAAYPAHLAAAQEQFVQLYASHFTALQLADLLAFSGTPAGAALLRQDADGRAIEEMVGREFVKIQARKARESFCAVHDCRGAIDPKRLAQDTTAPRPTVIIADPAWTQTPDAGQVEAARPPLAKALGLGGVARLTCKVAELGGLKGCEVADESPSGLGLGGAARSLAPFFRLSPTLLAQGAVGETTAVVVFFQATGDDGETFVGVPPRSTQAMALAREMLAASNTRTAGLAAWRDYLATSAPALDGVSPADRNAVFDTLQRAAEAAADEVSDLRAAYLTQKLTDAQLIAGARFWRGPSGTAWKAKARAIDSGSHAIGEDLRHLVWAEAGKIYCQTHECVTPRTAPLPVGAAAAPSTP